MTSRRHKSDTRTFNELTFSEQAKTINAQLATFTRATLAHISKAHELGRDSEKTKIKCMAQVTRLHERIGRIRTN